MGPVTRTSALSSRAESSASANSQNNKVSINKVLPDKLWFKILGSLPLNNLHNVELTCRYLHGLVKNTKLDILDKLDLYLGAKQKNLHFPPYSNEDRSLDRGLLGYLLFSKNGSEALNADPALKEAINILLSEEPDDSNTAHTETASNTASQHFILLPLARKFPSASDRLITRDPKIPLESYFSLFLREYREELKRALLESPITEPLSVATIQENVLSPIRLREQKYLESLRDWFERGYTNQDPDELTCWQLKYQRLEEQQYSKYRTAIV